MKIIIDLTGQNDVGVDLHIDEANATRREVKVALQICDAIERAMRELAAQHGGEAIKLQDETFLGGPIAGRG